MEETGFGLRADDAFTFGRQSGRPGQRERALLYTAGIPITQRGMCQIHLSCDELIHVYTTVDSDSDLHMFSSRPRRSTDQDSIVHPLLMDPANLSQSSPAQIRVHQRRPQRGTLEQIQNGMLQILDDAFGEGASGFFQHIVQRTVASGVVADIHVDIPATMHFMTGTDRGGHRSGQRRPPAYTIREGRMSGNRTDSADFGPLPTIQRLAEEAKIMHGKHLQDRLTKLVNHIVLALLPDARETARKEKEKAEALEKARIEAEAAAAAAAVASAAQEASSADNANSDVPADGVGATPVSTEVIPETTGTGVEDAEMTVEPSNVTVTPAQGPVSQESQTQEQEMDTENRPAEDAVEEGTPESPEAAQDTVDAPSTSTAPQRVTVLIHGNPVDITDTGIDPTFLEALPDDMREEVLNQHFRDQRTSRVEQAPESQISPEFLDALPPELRAEILQQERVERSRRNRQANDTQQAADAGPTGPVDMDTATFIASLDPHLRQVVLLDQDDGFLQTLPSHMIAEVGAYREAMPRMQLHSRPGAPPATTNAQAPRKLAPPRDAIQLLDRSGVTSLVRLLFFPKIRRHTLHKILLNLCENTKTRTELFNLLLSVLQDGTGDVALVDRSFSQLSFKPAKAATQTPSKAPSRPRANTEYEHSASNLHVPNEVPPDLVAQRCLDALASIVVNNEASSLFFLTEHELPAGLRKSSSKKGKGKEKLAPQSHYPIVLLLSLLDRQTLLKTPAIMDSVAGLLDAVTRPLVSLKAEKAVSSGTAAVVSTEATGEGATDATGAGAEGHSTNNVTDVTATPGMFSMLMMYDLIR